MRIPALLLLACAAAAPLRGQTPNGTTLSGLWQLEKGKVKVLVSFFGRETPVELDFLQVERM